MAAESKYSGPAGMNYSVSMLVIVAVWGRFSLYSDSYPLIAKNSLLQISTCGVKLTQAILFRDTFLTCLFSLLFWAPTRWEYFNCITHTFPAQVLNDCFRDLNCWILLNFAIMWEKELILQFFLQSKLFHVTGLEI